MDQTDNKLGEKMQLGTQTASLSNHLLSRAVIGQPDPVPGMGATLLAWTDRYAATMTDDMAARLRQDNRLTGKRIGGHLCVVATPKN